MVVVTQKALALELGIVPSRVSNYVRRGMPTVDGGLDREACLDWIARNVMPQGGQHGDKGASRVNQMRRPKDAPDSSLTLDPSPTLPGSHFPPSVSSIEELLDPPQERARRDRAATRRLEIESAHREGQLLSADEVRAAWIRVLALVRTNLLGIPSKLAQRLAGRSAPEIQAILQQEIHDVLRALATPVVHGHKSDL